VLRDPRIFDKEPSILTSISQQSQYDCEYDRAGLFHQCVGQRHLTGASAHQEWRRRTPLKAWTIEFQQTGKLSSPQRSHKPRFKFQ
jgi:hypothetical protein